MLSTGACIWGFRTGFVYAMSWLCHGGLGLCSISMIRTRMLQQGFVVTFECIPADGACGTTVIPASNAVAPVDFAGV